jgi:hypothetical protein
MWKRFINGDIYRDIPTPLLFVLGPLLGLAYLFVMPLVWIAGLIILPFHKARKVGTSEHPSAGLHSNSKIGT